MKPLSRAAAILLSLVGLPTTLPAIRAADVDPLKAALDASLLPPGSTAREIRAFIEPRIIRPPEFSDRAEWEKAAGRLRRDVLEQIVFRGAAARWRDAKCNVEWLDTIGGGPGYSIQKFRYEALPGMWIPGLLYLPERLEGRVPLALNVNGHDAKGKAVDYKQLRSINLVKRGMMVLNVEWFGMGQLRTDGFAHGRMNQLDLCGASGLAPFYLAMKRALDLGLALEHADPNRVVVSGLSGGGWQTIVISSLDERVTLANPVAGYGSFRTNIAFDDMGDSEQAPSDMAVLADYTHLTALRAPRPTLLTYNAADQCCFKSDHTLAPLLAAARPIFSLYGAEDRLRSHVNHVPGTHNFEQENREKFYAIIGDFLYADDKNFVRTEIPSESELKTAEELNVPLPADNVDFHRLAQSLMTPLPLAASLPTQRRAAESWQRQKREQLKALLKVPHYEAKAAVEKSRRQDDFRITTRILTLGDSWTVPVVEIASVAEPDETILLVADEGRASAGTEAARLVSAGKRVVAVDPLFLGEAKLGAQDPEYTFGLFVAAVGERPLGIQAAQLAAVARWLKTRHAHKPVGIVAVGRRASAAAIVAAAVEPTAIDKVDLTGSLASFKQLIEEDVPVEKLPELFAFGLLAEFDVCQIVALSAPRPVTLRDGGDRARRELAPLESWYALFGVNFHPAP
ncbi:MAG: hypothetical protein WD063_05630 [Pirellulales bacterium]